LNLLDLMFCIFLIFDLQHVISNFCIWNFNHGLDPYIHKNPNMSNFKIIWVNLFLDYWICEKDNSTCQWKMKYPSQNLKMCIILCFIVHSSKITTISLVKLSFQTKHKRIGNIHSWVLILYIWTLLSIVDYYSWSAFKARSFFIVIPSPFWRLVVFIFAL